MEIWLLFNAETTKEQEKNMHLIKTARGGDAEHLRDKRSFGLPGLFLPALILESVFSSGYRKLVSSVKSDIKDTKSNTYR